MFGGRILVLLVLVAFDGTSCQQGEALDGSFTSTEAARAPATADGAVLFSRSDLTALSLATASDAVPGVDSAREGLQSTLVSTLETSTRSLQVDVTATLTVVTQPLSSGSTSASFIAASASIAPTPTSDIHSDTGQSSASSRTSVGNSTSTPGQLSTWVSAISDSIVPSSVMTVNEPARSYVSNTSVVVTSVFSERNTGSVMLFTSAQEIITSTAPQSSSVLTSIPVSQVQTLLSSFHGESFKNVFTTDSMEVSQSTTNTYGSTHILSTSDETQAASSLTLQQMSTTLMFDSAQQTLTSTSYLQATTTAGVSSPPPVFTSSAPNAVFSTQNSRSLDPTTSGVSQSSLIMYTMASSGVNVPSSSDFKDVTQSGGSLSPLMSTSVPSLQASIVYASSAASPTMSDRSETLISSVDMTAVPSSSIPAKTTSMQDYLTSSSQEPALASRSSTPTTPLPSSVPALSSSITSFSSQNVQGNSAFLSFRTAESVGTFSDSDLMSESLGRITYTPMATYPSQQISFEESSHPSSALVTNGGSSLSTATGFSTSVFFITSPGTFPHSTDDFLVTKSSVSQPVSADAPTSTSVVEPEMPATRSSDLYRSTTALPSAMPSLLPTAVSSHDSDSTGFPSVPSEPLSSTASFQFSTQPARISTEGMLLSTEAILPSIDFHSGSDTSYSLMSHPSTMLLPTAPDVTSSSSREVSEGISESISTSFSESQTVFDSSHLPEFTETTIAMATSMLFSAPTTLPDENSVPAPTVESSASSNSMVLQTMTPTSTVLASITETFSDFQTATSGLDLSPVTSQSDPQLHSSPTDVVGGSEEVLTLVPSSSPSALPLSVVSSGDVFQTFPSMSASSEGASSDFDFGSLVLSSSSSLHSTSESHKILSMSSVDFVTETSDQGSQLSSSTHSGSPEFASSVFSSRTEGFPLPSASTPQEVSWTYSLFSMVSESSQSDSETPLQTPGEQTSQLPTLSNPASSQSTPASTFFPDPSLSVGMPSGVTSPPGVVSPSHSDLQGSSAVGSESTEMISSSFHSAVSDYLTESASSMEFVTDISTLNYLSSIQGSSVGSNVSSSSLGSGISVLSTVITTTPPSLQSELAVTETTVHPSMSSVTEMVLTSDFTAADSMLSAGPTDLSTTSMSTRMPSTSSEVLVPGMSSPLESATVDVSSVESLLSSMTSSHYESYSGALNQTGVSTSMPIEVNVTQTDVLTSAELGSTLDMLPSGIQASSSFSTEVLLTEISDVHSPSYLTPLVTEMPTEVLSPSSSLMPMVTSMLPQSSLFENATVSLPFQTDFGTPSHDLQSSLPVLHPSQTDVTTSFTSVSEAVLPSLPMESESFLVMTSQSSLSVSFESTETVAPSLSAPFTFSHEEISTSQIVLSSPQTEATESFGSLDLSMPSQTALSTVSTGIASTTETMPGLSPSESSLPVLPSEELSQMFTFTSSMSLESESLSALDTTIYLPGMTTASVNLSTSTLPLSSSTFTGTDTVSMPMVSMSISMPDILPSVNSSQLLSPSSSGFMEVSTAVESLETSRVTSASPGIFSSSSIFSSESIFSGSSSIGSSESISSSDIHSSSAMSPVLSAPPGFSESVFSSYSGDVLPPLPSAAETSISMETSQVIIASPTIFSSSSSSSSLGNESSPVVSAPPSFPETGFSTGSSDSVVPQPSIGISVESSHSIVMSPVMSATPSFPEISVFSSDILATPPTVVSSIESSFTVDTSVMTALPSFPASSFGSFTSDALPILPSSAESSFGHETSRVTSASPDFTFSSSSSSIFESSPVLTAPPSFSQSELSSLGSDTLPPLPSIPFSMASSFHSETTSPVVSAVPSYSLETTQMVSTVPGMTSISEEVPSTSASLSSSEAIMPPQVTSAPVFSSSSTSELPPVVDVSPSFSEASPAVSTLPEITSISTPASETIGISPILPTTSSSSEGVLVTSASPTFSSSIFNSTASPGVPVFSTPSMSSLPVDTATLTPTLPPVVDITVTGDVTHSFEASTDFQSASSASFSLPTEEVSTQLTTVVATGPSPVASSVPETSQELMTTTVIGESSSTPIVPTPPIPPPSTELSASSEPKTSESPSPSIATITETTGGVVVIPSTTQEAVSSVIIASPSTSGEAVTSSLYSLPPLTSVPVLEPSETSSAIVPVEPTSSLEPELSTSVMMSSSTPVPPEINITTPVPTTPSLNTSEALVPFWVVTVIRVPRGENVGSEEFRVGMEKKLANAYSEAFLRQQQIDDGTYEPNLRRRKRYAVSDNGDVELQMINITRAAAGTNVSMVYLLQQNQSYVPSTVAVSHLRLLSDQELALRLGYVVSSQAEPFIPVTPTVSPVTQPDNKLWIIGAVLGPIAFILLLWLVICIFCRCCRKPQEDPDSKQNQLQLMKMKKGQAEEEELYEEGQRSNGAAPRVSIGMGKRKSYQVNPRGAPLDNQPYLHSRGRAGEPGSEGGSQPSVGEDVVTYVTENAATAASLQEPAAKKKKKKKKQAATTEDAEGVVIPAQASFQNSAPAKPLPRPRSLRGAAAHTPTPEEEREMLERAEEERKRNKQRLREQRQREKERIAAGRRYREAQQEIDSVLEAPVSADQPVPDVFLNKPKKSSPSKTNGSTASTGGHINDAFYPEEDVDDEGFVQPQQESLQEAKKRMHQLLEDAFSLISSSRSTIGSLSQSSPIQALSAQWNKVSPRDANVSDETLQVRSRKRDKQQAAASESGASLSPAEGEHKEKKHTPMFVNPPYMSQDSGLEAWSPYKGLDDITQITMPQAAEPEFKPPQHEKAKTTTFNESYPTSMRNNFFATEPGQPIVIRTKDLEGAGDGGPANSQNPGSRRHSTSNGYGATRTSTSDTGIGGLEQFHPIPRSAPVYLHGASASARRPSKSDGMEMQTLNGAEAHHRPTRNVGNEDEVDIIKESLRPGSNPRPLIDSIRNELKNLSRKAPNQGKGTGKDNERDVNV